MNLNAIVYRRPPGSGPVFQTIRINEKSAFENPPGVDLPAVLVLSQKDVTGRENFFETRNQVKGKELASIFLNRKESADGKLFIVNSKYQSVGTLDNAIKKFLGRVAHSDERKAYFMCIDEGLYEKVPKEPLPAIKEQLRAGPIFQKMGNLLAPTKLSKEDAVAKMMLDLIEIDNERGDDLLAQDKFRGSSYSCQLVRHKIMESAKRDETVMVEGESGTGKELVAEAIHKLSYRRKNPFVAVNISAISSELFELELFGGKKDFPNPGTPETLGAFREADGGTLFLDEIGDMASFHQPKILRALSKNRENNMCEIRPVGYNKTIQVDVRIIAATNQNVKEKDKYGRPNFRQELYSRLSQIIIRTPSLKSHPQDIPEYANHIWKEFTKDRTATLPADLLELLQTLTWDDNVRGLRNLLKDLHVTFGIPTVEKLKALLQYRKSVDEAAITHEKVISAELSDMIEILAKASHSAWFEKRQADGWVWGPKRIETEEIKANPDMKPYNELSEAQKSYARDEARAILKAILNEGYSIVK